MRSCHDGRVSTCPTLATKRLVLRPFRDDDVEDLFAVMDTPQVRRSLHLPDHYGRENAWSQMAMFVGQWELRGTGNWALEDRDTGVFVGRAGLHLPEREGWPGLEIGWVLHPDHWGKGFATEAGVAAMRYAFKEVHIDGCLLDRVYSCILPDNSASQAVARRLGMELLEERVLPYFPLTPHGIWSRGR